MGEFRDFDADIPEAPSFQLGGVTFHCIPELGLPALTALTVSPSNDLGTLQVQIGEFFEMVIVDEEADAMRALLADKMRAPGYERLQAIIQWLTEVYTGRPTSAASDSAPGSESSGTALTGNSSSPATLEEQAA